MKILVLGGNGFIGKNIVEYLKEKEQIYHPPRKELNLLDTIKVTQFLRKMYFDIIIFSAVNINSLHENLIMYFNVRKNYNYFGKIITIGSGAEYDMNHYIPLMTEDYFNQFIPSDTYGLSKYIISSDIEYTNINGVNLRLFGIFGKYEDYKRRFISNNIYNVLTGKNIIIYKNMMFDYLYIKDFLKILDFFIYNDSKYKNYNVCTSHPIELLQLAKIIYKIHNDKNIKIEIKESGMKPEYSGSNKRLLNEIGPFNFTDFQTSITELYSWYKTNNIFTQNV